MKRSTMPELKEAARRDRKKVAGITIALTLGLVVAFLIRAATADADKFLMSALVCLLIGCPVLAVNAIVRAFYNQFLTELAIREQLVTQESVDRRLRELAIEAHAANLLVIDLQRKKAESRSDDADLEKRLADAEAHFKTQQEKFFVLFRALERRDYHLGWSKDRKASFKLYLPESAFPSVA